MQNYTSQFNGTKVVENTVSGIVVSSPVARRVTFTVQNGLVQGNFKDPNPINWTKEDAIFGRGRDTSRTGNGTIMVVNTVSGVQGDVFAPNHIDGSPSDYFPALLNKCMQKLYEQARGETSNLAVDLAESHQTLRMLRNALSVKRMARTFVKDVWKKAPKGSKSWTTGQQLDYVSSKWLGYRYGWQPLVYSTYDALGTLSKAMPNGYCRLRGTSKVISSKTQKSGAGTYSSPERLVVSTSSWRARREWIFKLDPGLTLYDWTSLNPFAIAWELVPLSFVGDWFFNVGEVLDMYQDYWRYRNSLVKGWTGQSYRRDTFQLEEGHSAPLVQYNPNGTVKIGSYGGDWSNMLWKRKTTHYDRTIQMPGDVPLPMRPQLRVNLNATRVADAGALIKVILLGSTRR